MQIHINQLPLKRNYIVLNVDYHEWLFDQLLELSGSIAGASRITKISETTISNRIQGNNYRIRIDFLLQLIDCLNISLEEVEKNIIWIGSNQSRGIINPKLPFTFNSRASARFLAAICNEGWISGGAYYSNSEQELRDSVKQDTISIFGGINNTVKEWIKEKDQYLAFPSIIRDVLVFVTDFKGVKSENNPPVPSFILENDEMICGWIEQTIADEGHVKHYPKKYRREIIWRRSFSKDLKEFKLNRDEQKMLDKIDIEYDVRNVGSYKTKKGIEKVKMHVRLSKRENLIKLRKLVKIPLERKEKTFSDFFETYSRYKEPLRVKNKIIEICRERGFVTSLELQKGMNYKRTQCAKRWLNFYLSLGFLKCVQKHISKGNKGLTSAIYALNKP